MQKFDHNMVFFFRKTRIIISQKNCRKSQKIVIIASTPGQTGSEQAIDRWTGPHGPGTVQGPDSVAQVAKELRAQVSVLLLGQRRRHVGVGTLQLKPRSVFDVRHQRGKKSL
jgi:hypothetical protein